jgi:opacity protein-like surface antigen
VSTRVTFALMAGTSYDLTKNLKLDVGYRYSRIKGGDMFGFDSGTAALGATGVQGSHGDLSTHQVKAGLRYEIW